MDDVKERNFLVGIFGDNYDLRNLVGQSLGSPGTKSDIQFYNRLDNSLGHVFCALTPIEYPEKIKPFLQTLSITNIYILVIDLESGLNPVIGEILVGMDTYNRLFQKRALVIISNISSKTEWKLVETKKKIRTILDTTTLKDSEIIEIREKLDYENIKKKITEIGTTLPESEVGTPTYTKVLIDHSFPVKGIGTVILGIVKNGELSVNQMLELIGYEDSGKKVIIRSIQKQDRDYKTAYEGDRVGLALKGNISHDQISRDNILVNTGIFKQEKKIVAKVHINQFFIPKEGIIKPGNGIQYFGMVEIKSSPLKFVEGEDLLPGKTGKVTIELEKSLVHDGTGLKGVITEMNKFENKLRIVGSFEQILN